MSRKPASAKNSASAMVETVIGPGAPPCCIRPISMVLGVFTCGRKATPEERALARIRAQFCSTMVRSTRNAGVVTVVMFILVTRRREDAKKEDAYTTYLRVLRGFA